MENAGSAVGADDAWIAIPEGQEASVEACR